MAIYTSRQLLDPTLVSNYRTNEYNNYMNRIKMLGEAGSQMNRIIKERSKRNQEQQDLKDRQKLIEEWSASEDFNNPQFRAALYSFQKTGDRSGIDNYYQTQALNKAREEEALKAKEEKIRSLDNLENAIANSDNWNTSSDLYEKAIQKANELGDIERMNRLQQEYDNLSKTEEMWKAQKPTRPTVEEIEQQYGEESIHKQIENRVKNLPLNKDERNTEIDKLNKLVADYGIKDIVIPTKSTKPSRKEVLEQLNSNKIGYSAAKKLYKDIKLNKTTRRYE